MASDNLKGSLRIAGIGGSIQLGKPTKDRAEQIAQNEWQASFTLYFYLRRSHADQWMIKWQFEEEDRLRIVSL